MFTAQIFLWGGGGEEEATNTNVTRPFFILFAKKKIDQEIQNKMPITLSGSRNRHYILKVVLGTQNIYKAVSLFFLTHGVKIQ